MQEVCITLTVFKINNYEAGVDILQVRFSKIYLHTHCGNKARSRKNDRDASQLAVVLVVESSAQIFLSGWAKKAVDPFKIYFRASK